MAKPRGKDPPEFKLRAVAMMTDQGLSVAEVARQLGVDSIHGKPCGGPLPCSICPRGLVS
jgi:ferredoxin